VTVASSAGTNGAATRSSATTSPVVNDPNTTQPMCPRGSGAEGDGLLGPSPGVAVGTMIGVIGVVATMDSIRCSGVARVQLSALVARAVVWTVAPLPRYWTREVDRVHRPSRRPSAVRQTAPERRHRATTNAHKRPHLTLERRKQVAHDRPSSIDSVLEAETEVVEVSGHPHVARSHGLHREALPGELPGRIVESSLTFASAGDSSASG
jgi:hypothetical protein